MPIRDIHQRRAYAARRASLAVDRMVRTTSPIERNQAILWAKAWRTRAGLLKALTHRRG